MNFFSGEIAGIGRQYLLLGLRRNLFDSFTWSMFSITNLDDPSVVMLPTLDYQFIDDISVSLGSTFFIGDSVYSEYGSFSSSIYLKINAYF